MFVTARKCFAEWTPRRWSRRQGGPPIGVSGNNDAAAACPYRRLIGLGRTGGTTKGACCGRKIGKGHGVVALPLPARPGTCSGKAMPRSGATRWSERSRTVGRAASVATCRTVCAAPMHDERWGGETTAGQADVGNASEPARAESVQGDRELCARFERDVRPLRDQLFRVAARLTDNQADAEDLLRKQ
jgi:hypothetical protein